MNPETTKIIAKWALGDDTGISSKFLAACALGHPDASERWIGGNTPSDNADFGRCYRLSLLLTAEELVKALEMAAERSTRWKTIKENWTTMQTKYMETVPPCRIEGCYNGIIERRVMGFLESVCDCPGSKHIRSREFYKLMKKLGL